MRTWRGRASGVGLAVAMWLGAGSGSAAIDEPTAATLEYVSEEASVVAYANVRALMASPLRARLRELSAAHPAIGVLEEWSGASLERDVDDIVFAGEDAAGDGRLLLILAGRFDSRRPAAYARDHGGRIEAHDGTQIVLAPRPSGEVAMALPASGQMLVGDAASVRRALDTKAGAARAISDSAGFMSVVAGLEPSAAWSVTAFQTFATRSALPAEVAAQLPPIDWLAVSGQFMPAARGQLRAAARDERAAQNLREVMRGFVALARMQGARNRELRGALDTVTLGGEGAIVSLSFDLTPGVLSLIDAQGVWRLAMPWLGP